MTDLPLLGLKRIQRQRMGDKRGFFSRLFCATELSAAGWAKPIAQINHSCTAIRGTVRGMHFQHPPHAEMKLVSCLRGKVWDVAVDLRAGSPTLLQWHAEYLSAENGVSLLIPEGFAHGFQTLADDCEMLYFHTTAYCHEAEGGVHAEDPRLAIHWPLPVAGLSSRDGAHPFLDANFAGVAA
jgi:dTDP-4-dehydrorhamnose 3,5-epimerase